MMKNRKNRNFKRLTALLLTALLALSCAAPAFADSTSYGVPVEGWNGWTGEKVTTEANPAPGQEADDVLKVEAGQTATLTLPDGFGLGAAILTADFYAQALQTATIALQDADGHDLGTISLDENGKVNGTETAYNAGAWNTVHLLVLPGGKRYQVYLGDDFVAAGTVNNEDETVSVPKKAVFTAGGSDLYLNNVKVEKGNRNQYQADELDTVYQSNFGSPENGATVKGVDGWDCTNTEAYTANMEYTFDTNAPENGGLAVKMERKQKGAGDGTLNRMSRSLDLDGDVVIEMDLYQPTTYLEGENNALFELFARTNQNDTITTDQASNNVSIVRLSAGNVLLSNATVTCENKYTPGKWFKLRVEVLRDTASANIYIDGTRVNDQPVSVRNTNDEKWIGHFWQLNLDVVRNTNLGIWYAKNISIYTPKDPGKVTLYAEDFEDGIADGLTHGGGDGNNNLALTVESGATLKESHNSYTNFANLSKVGVLNDPTYSGYQTVHVLPQTDTLDETHEKKSSKKQEFYSVDLNEKLTGIDNLKEMRISYQCFNTSTARKQEDGGRLSTIRDALYIGLLPQLKDSGIGLNDGAGPWIGVQSGNVRYLSNSANQYGTIGTNEWAKVEMVWNAETKNVSVYTNGTLSSKTFPYELDAASSLRYFFVEIETSNGGCFYLDDILVEVVGDPVTKPAKDSYTFAPFHEDGIQRDNMRFQFKVDSVAFTNGQGTQDALDGATGIQSVTLTRQREWSGNAKLFAAAFSAEDETKLLQSCAVAEVTAGTLNQSQEISLAEAGFDCSQAAQVKLFLFDAATLEPLAEATIYTK